MEPLAKERGSGLSGSMDIGDVGKALNPCCGLRLHTEYTHSRLWELVVFFCSLCGIYCSGNPSHVPGQGLGLNSCDADCSVLLVDRKRMGIIFLSQESGDRPL